MLILLAILGVAFLFISKQQRQEFAIFRKYIISPPKLLAILETCENKNIQNGESDLICNNRYMRILAASTYVKQGEELVKEGDFKNALLNFNQAIKFNARLNFNPEQKAAPALIISAIKMLEEGNLDQASDKLKKALTIDSSLDLNPETERLEKPEEIIQ